MAKAKENLKGIQKDELTKRVVHLQEQIRAINFKAEGSKPKNVKETMALKKQIARILTEINSPKSA